MDTFSCRPRAKDKSQKALWTNLLFLIFQAKWIVKWWKLGMCLFCYVSSGIGICRTTMFENFKWGIIGTYIYVVQSIKNLLWIIETSQKDLPNGCKIATFWCYHYMSWFSHCFLVSGRDRNDAKQKQKEANCLPQEQEGSHLFASNS